MRRPLLLVAVLALVGLALTDAVGAARRNMTYLRLSRGHSAELVAPATVTTRANERLALRVALAGSDWSTAARLFVADEDRDRLAAMLLIHDGEQRATAGDLAGARAALSIVETRPGYEAEVWYRLGEAWQRAHAPADAVRMYARGSVIDAAAPWTEGRYRAALVDQAESRWQSVVDALAPLMRSATDQEIERPIQASDPGGAVWQGTLLMLGEAYDHLGNAAEAEATYDRVARIAVPRRDWTLNRSLVYLGRARSARGDFIAALDPMTRALDLATTFEPAYRKIFELDTAKNMQQTVDRVRQLGRLDALQVAVDDITRRSPSGIGAWFLHGLVSEALCDRGAARASYERVARLLPAGVGAFLEGRPGAPASPCPAK